MSKSEPKSGKSAILTLVENGVALITLNRPDRMNAFTWGMGNDLNDALVRFDHTREDAPGIIADAILAVPRMAVIAEVVEVAEDLAKALWDMLDTVEPESDYKDHWPTQRAAT